MVIARSKLEVTFCKTWTGMRQGVSFKGNAFLEPRLKLRIRRVHPLGHDTQGRATIDFFEPIEDRTQKRLVLAPSWSYRQWRESRLHPRLVPQPIVV